MALFVSLFEMRLELQKYFRQHFYPQENGTVLCSKSATVLQLL